MNNDDIADALIEASELTNEQRMDTAVSLAAELRSILGYVVDAAAEGSSSPYLGAQATAYATALDPWIHTMVLARGRDHSLRRDLVRLHARCEVMCAQEVICASLKNEPGKRADKARRIWKKMAEEACDEAHRVLVALIRMRGESDG